MQWGDPGEALRAQTELALRHADEVRARARSERERAGRLRGIGREAAEAAERDVHTDGEVLHCRRCHAVWRAEAIAEVMRREPRCLLCGGLLGPVP